MGEPHHEIRMLRLRVHPETPQERHIQRAVSILKEGGIAIVPTDAVYVLAGDLTQRTVLERLVLLKGLEPGKAIFSILCASFSQMAEYVAPLDKERFRLLKRYLPGPYTFIMEASRQVPRLFLNRRHTIGIRIPDHPVPRRLAEALGNPLVSTSLYDEDGEYLRDPEEIERHWKRKVEVFLDSGPGSDRPTTVIDLTGETPTLLRQGRGKFPLEPI